MHKRAWTAAAVLILALSTSCGPGIEVLPANRIPASRTTEVAPGIPTGAQPARVERVIDGDTIWVVPQPPGPLAEGKVYKIRILEIDAPEAATPDLPAECWAAEATGFARAELPLGSTVYLLADREDVDQYGRSLRYVWDAAGEFYNEKVVAGGHARAVLFRPNDLYIDRIRAAEQRAKSAGLGIWGRCTQP